MVKVNRYTIISIMYNVYVFNKDDVNMKMFYYSNNLKLQYTIIEALEKTNATKKYI